MKMVNPNFYFSIEFKENQVISIVMESAEDLQRFINDMINIEDSQWIISQEGEEIPFHKCAEIIINPFTLELNQRKMITKLYDQLHISVQSSEKLMEWNRVCSSLCEFTENVISECDYALSYTETIDFKEFLKFLNIKFEQEGEFLDRIIDYVQLLNEVLGIKVFFFVHLKSFLKQEELELLYKTAFYRKIQIVLVESQQMDKVENEKQFIIDKDHCVVYN